MVITKLPSTGHTSLPYAQCYKIEVDEIIAVSIIPHFGFTLQAGGVMG